MEKKIFLAGVMYREERIRNLGNVSNIKRCEIPQFFNKYVISNAKILVIKFLFLMLQKNIAIPKFGENGEEMISCNCFEYVVTQITL